MGFKKIEHKDMESIEEEAFICHKSKVSCMIALALDSMPLDVLLSIELRLDQLSATIWSLLSLITQIKELDDVKRFKSTANQLKEQAMRQTRIAIDVYDSTLKDIESKLNNKPR